MVVRQLRAVDNETLRDRVLLLCRRSATTDLSFVVSWDFIPGFKLPSHPRLKTRTAVFLLARALIPIDSRISSLAADGDDVDATIAVEIG